jgi:hypothetical protein
MKIQIQRARLPGPYNLGPIDRPSRGLSLSSFSFSFKHAFLIFVLLARRIDGRLPLRLIIFFFFHRVVFVAIGLEGDRGPNLKSKRRRRSKRRVPWTAPTGDPLRGATLLPSPASTPTPPLVAIGALSSSLRRAAGSSKRCTLIPFASTPKFIFFHLIFQSCLLPPSNYMHAITRICGVHPYKRTGRSIISLAITDC